MSTLAKFLTAAVSVMALAACSVNTAPPPPPPSSVVVAPPAPAVPPGSTVVVPRAY